MAGRRAGGASAGVLVLTVETVPSGAISVWVLEAPGRGSKAGVRPATPTYTAPAWWKVWSARSSGTTATVISSILMVTGRRPLGTSTSTGVPLIDTAPLAPAGPKPTRVVPAK